MSTQNERTYYDENSSRMQLAHKPLSTTGYSGLGFGAAGFSKPNPALNVSKAAADKDAGLARRPGRTALGDISNRVTDPAPQMVDAKKKLGLATSNAQSTSASFQAPGFYKPVSGGPAAGLLDQTNSSSFASQTQSNSSLSQPSSRFGLSAFSSFNAQATSRLASASLLSGSSLTSGMQGASASTSMMTASGNFDAMGEGRAVLDTQDLLDDPVGRLSSNMTELSLQASNVVREAPTAPAAMQIPISAPLSLAPKVQYQSQQSVQQAQPVSQVQPQQESKLSADRITSMTQYPLSTFDEKDRHNPQMVSVYVDDIIQHLRNTEARRQPSANYMSRQTDINAKMREILIDWLVEVHLKFKLRQETLYLTVSIIDRFLERRAVSRSKLQLVGCTAMLLASKYEEIFSPEVQDFVYVTDKAYTREQILAMESIILNALEFNLTVPYAMRFAERYARFASESDQFTSMVMYLIEITLQDYKFLKFLPSMIASAAVSLALHLSGHEAWPRVLQEQTQYTEADIRQCVMDLWHLAAQENPKYRAVRKKYASSRFHGVGKITIDPPSTN